MRQNEWTVDMVKRSFDCLHGFWEKDNGPLLDIEEQILIMFRWEYGDPCDPSNRQRNTKGGCIKDLLVKEKNHILDKLKIAIR
jgi:hypothetical protein